MEQHPPTKDLAIWREHFPVVGIMLPTRIGVAQCYVKCLGTT